MNLRQMSTRRQSELQRQIERAEQDLQMQQSLVEKHQRDLVKFNELEAEITNVLKVLYGDPQ